MDLLYKTKIVTVNWRDRDCNLHPITFAELFRVNVLLAQVTLYPEKGPLLRILNLKPVNRSTIGHVNSFFNRYLPGAKIKSTLTGPEFRFNKKSVSLPDFNLFLNKIVHTVNSETGHKGVTPSRINDYLTFIKG